MGRFDTLDRRRLQELLLHELGDALGLEHEHQSPEAKCDEEFDWDRIYPYAQAQWGWDKGKVDRNMRALSAAARLRTTPYDRQSIMHYTFDDWMFKQGKASRCFVSQAETASVTDLDTVRTAYPVHVSPQDDHLQQRAKALGSALGASRLDTEQLAKAGMEIGGVLDHRKGKLQLEFVLAPDAWASKARSGSDLAPCDGTPKPRAAVSVVTCGVAPDASGFVIAVNPR